MTIAGSLVVTVTARTQDFEAGMRKTTATLKLTEAQAQQVTHAFSTMGTAFSQTGSKAQQTSTALTGLTRSLVGLTAGVVSIQAVSSAITSSVQAAMKLDALNLAFGAITGSAKGAADAMAFLRDTADRLGVQVESIAGGYRTLLAATKSTNLGLKETQTLFLGLVEASRAMGLSAEDTAGAIRPMTQIISQQAFQADELRNELGARLPVALDLLVKASNGAFKSVGELFKAMEEGKLKGQVALDLTANFGVVLRQQFAPAAEAASQSAAAAFERVQQAVTDLQVALGRELLPTLADVARAMTAMLKGAQDTTSAFGQGFTVVIREAASAAIGLAGSIGVLANAIHFLQTPNDPAEAAKRWDVLKQSFLDVATAQHQILNPPQLTRLNPKLPPLPANYGTLRPIVPGGEEDGKAAKKTAVERESERIAKHQKDLVSDIADAYDAANAAQASGVELARTRMEQELRQAGFAQADLNTLMTTYDATQRLLQQHKEDQRLTSERLQLSTQLQEDLDRQLYTERELMQRKLTTLGFSKEEAALKLKMFDTEVRLREEAEKRKEAEQDAVQATKEHLDTLMQLQEQLQPNRRQTRAQELQGVVSQIATETSDPYRLAQAAQQMQETLDTERWEEWRNFAEDSLSQVGDAITQFAFHGKLTFKEMVESLAEDFFRMSLRMVTQSAFGSAGGGSGEGWLGMALGAGLKLLGLGAGIGGGAGGAPGGIEQSSFGGGGGAAFGPPGTSFAFGGGRQHGGPVMPGKFYTVGEHGPETFVPRTSGTIVPGGQNATTVINVHVSGVHDAQSFVQSRGAVSRAMMSAMAQARQQM